jgi:splicing factor 3B subunit 1
VIFILGGKTPDVGSRTYSQIMQEQKLKGEENEVRKTIIDKAKDGNLRTNGEAKGTVRKRGRWDQVVQNGDSSGVPAKKKTNSAPWEEVSYGGLNF